jgi:diaminopimelate decarboxylase
VLLTSVITTKEADDGVHFAVLDAGINLAEGVRSEYHQLFAVNRYGKPADLTYTLAGPICSPGDVLYLAWDLPHLAPGDSLAIMDSGAYFVPFSTSFSFPRPAIVLVNDGEDTLLRRAESFADLVTHDVEVTLERPAQLAADEQLVVDST